jgi:hypothetical protein
LYRQGEALILLSAARENPKEACHPMMELSALQEVLGCERESWQITVWCDWLRLGERLIPPYKITIIFLNSLSFVEAVNKHSLFGLMERWENQAGVSEIRDFGCEGLRRFMLGSDEG